MTAADQHLRMVLSILLSLVVWELLSKLRVAADTWGKPSFHWLSFAWAGIILLAAVQLWWFLFTYLEHEVWSRSFFAFLELLLSPALLYAAGSALFPSDLKGGEADLRAHYYERHGWIFVPLAVFAAEPMIGTLITGGSLLRPQTPFQVLFATVAVVAAVSSNRRLHAVLPFVVGAALIGFVVLFRSGLD